METQFTDEELEAVQIDTQKRLANAIGVSRAEAEDLLRGCTYTQYPDPVDPRYLVIQYKLPLPPDGDSETESSTGIRALTQVVTNALHVAKGYYEQHGWPSDAQGR